MAKPESVTLICGDYREQLLQADAVITDPLFLRDMTPEEYELIITGHVRNLMSYAPVIGLFQPSFRPIPGCFGEWFRAEVRYTGQTNWFLTNVPVPWYLLETRATSLTPRPYEIMRPIVEALSSPGQRVLDPFMACGATADACEGRYFTGVEIDPKRYQCALDRLT